MKRGDIIIQVRFPGGMCLLVNIEESQPQIRSKNGWADVDYPVLTVLHPEEGLIEDPSYYYDTVAEFKSRLKLIKNLKNECA